MGDANRTRLSFKEESSWGVSPSTQAYQELRITGESLGFNIEFINSEELRSDRQITDLVQTGAEVAGGFNFELSYGSFDDLLEGALFSDWSDLATISGVYIEATANGFSAGATAAFANVVAGQWLKVSGFTASSINGFYRVLSLATGNTGIYTEVAPATTEAAGATVSFSGSIIRNGTTRHSYSFIREHLDMSPVVSLLFAGGIVSQLQMSVAANSILTGSFEFMGKDSSIATGAAGGFTSPATPTATTTTDVMNAVSNVGTIREGGSAVSSALVQSLEFTLGNALRGRQTIGTLGNASIGAGRIDCNGTITAYFLSKDLYEKYVNGTESSFSFKVEKDSQAYIITFPRIKYNEDTVNAEGNDTDVMENLGFQAIRHATYDCTIQIDRFAA